MKALVLCGGLPQIALMQELKNRGITVVLADMNEKVQGRQYCDIFYPVSTLDVEGIKNVAQKEKVDFLISVCADQVLQVVAEVSEMLGLPCYIDFATAVNVSKKSYMKRIFMENAIPTSQYVIMDSFDAVKIQNLKFPIIVKPVDSYSSRGVQKVEDLHALQQAFEEARNISRTKSAIVEEFVTGEELTVDVYVEGGIPHILCISKLDKIGDEGRFVIHRSTYPAGITEEVERQIGETAGKIAKAFGLTDTPMLIQLITDGKKISVVEFCARTGGGIKFQHIQRVAGFDVVKAVADLTMGQKPHVEPKPQGQKYIINEFLYCKPGVFDHLEGFEDLLEEGIITQYSQLKNSGTEFTQIKSSGDRVACYTIQTADEQSLRKYQKLVSQRIKVVSTSGEDLLRRDLVEKI